MTSNPFKPAAKSRSKLRLALIGPSGSGKTFTALTIACRLAERAKGRVALIDTERGSASLYADRFAFDVLELDQYDPRRYVDAIRAAESAGYPVIVIDSLSHAWSGKGGALDLVDQAAKRPSGGGNSFGAWREVTPIHNALVDAMLASPAHIIATMRAKTEYVQEKDDRTGKASVRKVGLAPVQRDGLEYEFTVVADMDLDNTLIVSKSRMAPLSGAVIKRPEASVADQLADWLESGAEPAPKPAEPSPAMPEHRAIPPTTNAGPAHSLTVREFSEQVRALGYTDAAEIARVLGIDCTDREARSCLHLCLTAQSPEQRYRAWQVLQAAARERVDPPAVSEEEEQRSWEELQKAEPAAPARTVASKGAHG